MDKPLNLVIELSLEEMALRRLVVKLWNEKDILLSFNYLKFYNIYEEHFKLEWQDKVECRVKDKVSKLVLPDSLKERMMKLVTPIGFEILRWIISCAESELISFEECLDIHTLEQLCWTSRGAVDFQKTVENLVRHVISNVEKRYELACKYCLVDLIKPIWEELSENAIEAFYNENACEKTTMETYWTYFLKGEEAELNSIDEKKFDCSFYFKAFTISANEGNKAATKYFFQKLPHRERDFLFIAIIEVITSRYDEREVPYAEFPEVVCYLLSQMSFKQQVEVFQAHPWTTLRFFLDWPLQDLFLYIEDKIRPFLPERHYYFNLYDIIGGVVDWGYHFPNLMQELFFRSPSDFRKLFLFRFGFLSFEFEDKETIRVVFQNVDIDAREHFVCCLYFLKLLRNLIMKDEWCTVKSRLQALSLSKKEKKCLKEAFFEFLNDDNERSPNQKWEDLLEFLDETEAIARRKTEDETQPKVKKLCTEEKRNHLSSN